MSKIKTADGEIIVIKEFNPNHDELGRFTFGSGPGGIQAVLNSTEKKDSADLDEQLGYMSDLQSSSRSGSLKYTSSEHMIYKLGQNFKPSVKPSKVKQGKIKSCFENATKLAISNSDYTYVEGYAFADINLNLPIAHAWVVDSFGKVIDNTWEKPGRAYSGIPISTSFLTKALSDTGVYGILSGANRNAYLAEGLPKTAVIEKNFLSEMTDKLKSSKVEHSYRLLNSIERISDELGLDKTQSLVERALEVESFEALSKRDRRIIINAEKAK
jgi:hypothetical protein